MGYNTIFKGTLKFTAEPTVAQLTALNAMFGQEWEDDYVDFRLTDDFLGIEWDDGTEKSRDLTKVVNTIIEKMRQQWPDFGLSGQLIAQGEDSEDRWALAIGENGLAHKLPIVITGVKAKCPECGHRFIIKCA
jgi:hypothetical protein